MKKDKDLVFGLALLILGIFTIINAITAFAENEKKPCGEFANSFILTVPMRCFQLKE